MKLSNVMAGAAALSSLSNGADAARPGRGSRFRGGSSDNSVSQNNEPTQSFFTDPKLVGANVPETGISRVDGVVTDLINSLSPSDQKLYLVVSTSNQISADEIVDRVKQDCGAKGIPSLQSAVYEHLLQSADIDSVARNLIVDQKPEHQVDIKTVDAAGRPEFENCIRQTVNGEVAQISGASSTRTLNDSKIAAGVALAFGFAAFLAN